MQQYDIVTKQTEVNSNLRSLLAKYSKTPYQYPINPQQHEAYINAIQWLTKQNKPLILDSGCGTGMSSFKLGVMYPECAVLGVDKSSHRLMRAAQPKYDNVCLVQANLIAFWANLVNDSTAIKKHYLLYPNPWPKWRQYKRRWYAHPIAQTLFQLGNCLELRTNWLLYAEEFAKAAYFFGWEGKVERLITNDAISLFEKKYLKANVPLFRLLLMR